MPTLGNGFVRILMLGLIEELEPTAFLENQDGFFVTPM